MAPLNYSCFVKVSCIQAGWNEQPEWISMVKCQTATNTFCLLLCVPEASREWLWLWSMCVFFSYSFSRRFCLWSLLKKTQIKCTSKHVKMKKRSNVQFITRYKLIEHICLLISWYSISSPLFSDLNVLSHSCRDALWVCPYLVFTGSETMVFWSA